MYRRRDQVHQKSTYTKLRWSLKSGLVDELILSQFLVHERLGKV